MGEDNDTNDVLVSANWVDERLNAFQSDDLTELLSCDDVEHDDGSWTGSGHTIHAPIVTGSEYIDLRPIP